MSSDHEVRRKLLEWLPEIDLDMATSIQAFMASPANGAIIDHAHANAAEAIAWCLERTCRDVLLISDAGKAYDQDDWLYLSRETLAREDLRAAFSKTHGVQATNQRRQCQQAFALTERERQILTYIVLGLTNIEIANQLGVQLQSVKNRVSIILSKLGVRNRTEAVRVAQDSNLV